MNSVPQFVYGQNLPLPDQQYALRAFLHRFTGDHTPDWALEPRKDGSPYPLQFRDDREWLKNTLFKIRKDGRIDRRSTHCSSYPTWPNNPELRRSAA